MANGNALTVAAASASANNGDVLNDSRDHAAILKPNSASAPNPHHGNANGLPTAYSALANSSDAGGYHQ